MEIPQLNTGGVDVRNTLALINSMQHTKAQEAQIPSLITKIESQNAVRVLQAKEAARKLESEKLDEAAKGVAWVKDHPEPDLAYDQFQKFYAKQGVPLPPVDTFYSKNKKGITAFDTDKFNEFAMGGIEARKMMLSPHEGDTKEITVLNDTFDKLKPVSVDNPRLVKRTYTVKNRQLVPDTSIPAEPVVDPIAKEKRLERESETGTWEAIGTTNDKKSVILRNNKTGKLKEESVPSGAELSGKPGPIPELTEVEKILIPKIKAKQDKEKASATPASTKPVIPTGAETGTYKGMKAYKLNNKFFSVDTGKEII